MLAVKDSYPSAVLYDLLKYRNLKYVFRNIPRIDNGIFLISGHNREEAEKDILMLNDIFAAAHKKEPEFPAARIYSDDIMFEFSDALDPHQFCHFELYDKTGNDKTDYILIMHFYITPDPRNIIYGDIFYLSDGSIGKFNTVFQHENDNLFINCKKNGMKLEIQPVVFDKGKRKKRFYPLIKIGVRAACFLSGVTVLIVCSGIITAFYIYDNIRSENKNIIIMNPETRAVSEPAPEPTSFETAENTIPESPAVRQKEIVDPIPPADAHKTIGTAVLMLISVTSPVKQGETAGVKINGLPDTVYSISVYYSSGVSSASGLENRKSDSSGMTEWNWKIGNRTKPGTYKIKIDGGGESIESMIEVVP